MITIDTSDPDVAALFTDCEPGESKTLTFTVREKTPQAITGDIETVEGYEDADPKGESEPPESEDDSEMPMKGGKHKMSKGLTLIIGAR